MDAIVGIVIIPVPGDFICGKQIERDAKREREGERQAGEVEEAGEKSQYLSLLSQTRSSYLPRSEGTYLASQ